MSSNAEIAHAANQVREAAEEVLVLLARLNRVVVDAEAQAHNAEAPILAGSLRRLREMEEEGRDVAAVLRDDAANIVAVMGM